MIRNNNNNNRKWINSNVNPDLLISREENVTRVVPEHPFEIGTVVQLEIYTISKIGWCSNNKSSFYNAQSILHKTFLAALPSFVKPKSSREEI